MIILSSIIFFHLASIFLAKHTRSERTVWLPIFIFTIAMTLCVLYLLHQIQPPDMGV